MFLSRGEGHPQSKLNTIAHTTARIIEILLQTA